MHQKVLCLVFFVICYLNGNSAYASDGDVCDSFIRAFDAGKASLFELPDAPSLLERFSKFGDKPIYTVKTDLNGDGVEEIFGSFPHDVSNGMNSKFGLALLKSDQLSNDEIPIDADADPINPITFDSREKRIFKINGFSYVVVFNTIYLFPKPIKTLRTVWRINSNFKLAVECEIGRFVREDGKTYHRILRSDERILRQAKELNTDPWDLIVNLPGIAAFEAVVSAGWNLNEPKYAWVKNRPLWVAIKADRLDLVKKFLSNGVSANLPERSEDRNAHSPIEYAIWQQKQQLAEVLIESAGAKNLTCNMFSSSPLAEAIVYDQLGIVKVLLDSGAEVDGSAIRDWLEFSRDRNSAKQMLELLIAHGMDLNKSYKFSFPASGISRVNADTVKVGPEVLFIEKYLTPLQYVQNTRNKTAEILLIQAGAK